MTEREVEVHESADKPGCFDRLFHPLWHQQWAFDNGLQCIIVPFKRVPRGDYLSHEGE